METEDKALIERERIKQIIDRKLKRFIELRKRDHKRYTFEGTLDRLEDDIFFLIDHPDYVKKSSPHPTAKSL